MQTILYENRWIWFRIFEHLIPNTNEMGVFFVFTKALNLSIGIPHSFSHTPS